MKFQQPYSLLWNVSEKKKMDKVYLSSLIILEVWAAHFSMDCFVHLSQCNANFAKRLLLKDEAIKNHIAADSKPADSKHVLQSTVSHFTCKKSLKCPAVKNHLIYFSTKSAKMTLTKLSVNRNCY